MGVRAASPAFRTLSASGGLGGAQSDAKFRENPFLNLMQVFRFVVHCDRRGCSGHGHGHHGTHAHSSSREGTPAGDDQQQQAPGEPYLTPTQRKQREISVLKKELR